MNLRFAVIVVLLGSLGCGGDEGPSPTATLSGKITLDGAPVVVGSRVMFRDPTTGRLAIGVVAEDGTYTAKTNDTSYVFGGIYQVSVVGPQIEVDPEEALKPDYKDPVDPTPAKYRDPETSGETVEVKAGDNTYNLDMKK